MYIEEGDKSSQCPHAVDELFSVTIRALSLNAWSRHPLLHIFGFPLICLNERKNLYDDVTKLPREFER